jgi:hypothetical protein
MTVEFRDEGLEEASEAMIGGIDSRYFLEPTLEKC